jgi:hypothetical protein
MRNKIHENWLLEFSPEYGETNSGDSFMSIKANPNPDVLSLNSLWNTEYRNTGILFPPMFILMLET